MITFFAALAMILFMMGVASATDFDVPNPYRWGLSIGWFVPAMVLWAFCLFMEYAR